MTAAALAAEATSWEAAVGAAAAAVKARAMATAAVDAVAAVGGGIASA